jgi:hypothetical protein
MILLMIMILLLIFVTAGILGRIMIRIKSMSTIGRAWPVYTLKADAKLAVR